MKTILKSGAVTASAFLLAGTLFIGSGIQISSQAHAAPDCGGASWYALRSRTASGEMMNPSAMTAAHRSLRFGTKVKVTNRHNGRSVVVRINDRGPFIKGRIIDLSKGAAGKLGFVGAGKTSVCIQIVS
jgi:rare lipoprotein A